MIEENIAFLYLESVANNLTAQHSVSIAAKYCVTIYMADDQTPYIVFGRSDFII